jgi:putative radical SAM enzyme (TIGR03279 family)
MRTSLYVKDEDFRFSFLYGAYVTLTNVTEADLQRIVQQRLSPLYVSVHATAENVRRTLLGRNGPPILELLRRLVEAGIEIHTQVVLCPGINDGVVLERTVAELHALAPGVRTLAVVPVGLTGYRRRLPQLRPVSVAEAALLIDQIEAWQQRFLEPGGSRFVFAADELYLRAARPVPALESYEDLAQIENGVGLIARFREEAREALAEAGPLRAGPVTVVTGESGFPEIQRFVTALGQATGVTIQLHPVANTFFGGHVTVTGLLTGKDLLRELQGRSLGEVLLVPDVMLKEGEDLLLDDLSLIDLERELGVPVRKIASTPWGLLEALEDLAEG